MRVLRVLTVLLALMVTLIPVGTARAEGPQVTVEGLLEAGRKAVAVVSGTDGGLSYSWTLDGEVTDSRQVPWGAVLPASEFMILEEHIGRELAVTVTITPATGEPVSISSEGAMVARGTVVANHPVVTGKPLIGETLSVNPNLLYPTDGVTITYQWLRYGQPISGATGRSLKLTADMRGWSRLSVEVTAKKPGWRDSVRRSSTDNNHVLPPAIETQGPISLTNPPTVGDRVSYTGWVCCVATEVETVEWLIDGKVVSRAANGELVVKKEWAGKSLVARVTRSRPFVPSVTLTTPKVTIRPSAALESVSVRASKAVVGWTATVDWSPEIPGIKKSVSWYRVDEQGNQWFSGATGESYRITGEDVGYRVGAHVAVQDHHGEVTLYNAEMQTPIAFNLYTTPGEHTVNGRQWRTTCETYSQTQRCRTEIIATQVVKVDGRWTRRTGWVFNNLTYLPMPPNTTWGSNKLANSQEWTDAAGRQWRTDCNPQTVGHNTCRTYITAHVTQALPKRGGGWTYETNREWVFNNMLYYE